MKQNQSIVSERIAEVEMMCQRDNPVYEQVTNFSVAFYILNHINATDLMSVEDIDSSAAAQILKDDFEQIKKSEIPNGFKITESDERYLLVIGDPAFPTHSGAIVDMQSKQPFFSKLEHWGCGKDSLNELMQVLSPQKEIGHQDINYYRKISS